MQGCDVKQQCVSLYECKKCVAYVCDIFSVSAVLVVYTLSAAALVSVKQGKVHQCSIQ